MFLRGIGEIDITVETKTYRIPGIFYSPDLDYNVLKSGTTNVTRNPDTLDGEKCHITYMFEESGVVISNVLEKDDEVSQSHTIRKKSRRIFR